jgi:hypothetical protein
VSTVIPFAKDSRVMMKYKKKKGCCMGKSNTNSILAAHVTMYGRLKLFDVMHNLGQRVLYCDTGYINISLKQNNLQTQSLPSPKRLLIDKCYLNHRITWVNGQTSSMEASSTKSSFWVQKTMHTGIHYSNLCFT